MPSVLLHTLNLAKLPLHSGDFRGALTPHLPAELPHLAVFAFQEMCPTIDGAFFASANKHLIELTRVVVSVLDDSYSLPFSVVGFHHIGAIGIVAVSPFPLRFRNVKTASAACGNFGTLLKGGAGLRIQYVEGETTEFTFAAMHLSAFEGGYYYNRRVQNLQTIMRALDFGDGFGFLKPRAHAFILGDLNFRAKQTETFSLENDELSAGMANNELLAGFTEHKIDFAPTYKFFPNTTRYNTKRAPSWCDRILFQNSYETPPEVASYRSLEYLRSDHRPVLLQVTVPMDSPALVHAGYLGPNSSGAAYVRGTALDKVQQLVCRPVADWTLGHGLWLATTTRGRLVVAVLLLWAVYLLL